MKYLYESKDPYFVCKLYKSDNKLIFETNSCGIDLKYTLSGHPYEPVLCADCNVPRYSFRIHGGLWFPVQHVDYNDRVSKDAQWEDFCKKLSIEINLRVAWLHNLPDEYEVDFSLINSRRYLLFKALEVPYCYFPIRNISSCYLEPALCWQYPNFPEDNVRVVGGGGYPDEYYIIISELTAEQKLMIRTTSGEHIVKKKKAHNERIYELKKDLKQGNDLLSPDLLVSNYDGFIRKTLRYEDSDHIIVYGSVEGIVFGRNLFVGSFRYDEDGNFQEIELLPILTPHYNEDEPKICRESISREGTRIGRFLINLCEYRRRIEGTESTKLFRTTIKIQKHPFFNELGELLDDSSMTDEEIVNLETQIETLLDKYKNKL